MKRSAISTEIVNKRKKKEYIDGFALSLIEFTVGVEPIYINNVNESIQNHLSKWIGKYQSNLHGFSLAYFDSKAKSNLGGTLGDCPSIYVPCEAKFLMFYPKVETKVQIKLVSSSPHHIGGLLLGVIHVSIPKDYIPNEYEFKFDNSITGKWSLNGKSFAIGDLISSTIIGTKKDGHEMTLIGTVATNSEEIKKHIRLYSPNHISMDNLDLNAESSSLDSDNSDEESGSENDSTSSDVENLETIKSKPPSVKINV
eukprot:NODE_696_length_5082_cov_0.330724.p2 type:complete len:255 gc:universal NODE_696_length_5082_cov_0.330724:3430-4194(+)